MPAFPGNDPRPSSPGARADDLGAWQARRFDPLRRHANASTTLVDELPDDPLDDIEGSRFIIDRHRVHEQSLVRSVI